MRGRIIRPDQIVTSPRVGLLMDQERERMNKPDKANPSSLRLVTKIKRIALLALLLALLAAAVALYWYHQRLQHLEQQLEQVDAALSQPLLVELRPLHQAPVGTAHATLGLAHLSGLLLLQIETSMAAYPGDEVTVELLQKGRSIRRSDLITSPNGDALLAVVPDELQLGELEVVVVGALDGTSYLIDLR